MPQCPSVTFRSLGARADPGFQFGGPGRGARIEAPQAPNGGRVWGGGVPLPIGEGSGEGAVPPPQKIF